MKVIKDFLGESLERIPSGKMIGILYSFMPGNKAKTIVPHKIGELISVQNSFAKEREKYRSLENLAGERFEILSISEDKISQEKLDSIFKDARQLAVFMKKEELL